MFTLSCRRIKNVGVENRSTDTMIVSGKIISGSSSVEIIWFIYNFGPTLTLGIRIFKDPVGIIAIICLL